MVGLLLLACVDRSDRAAGPQVTAPEFAAGQGQEALSRVMAIQGRHTERLLAVPGVVGTATGVGSDGRPVVLVLTRDVGVVGLPPSLEGAPVEVLVTGEISALPQDDPTPAAGGRAAAQLKSQVRPVPNGVSVSNDNQCAAGTLGVAVLIGGSEYALSNNHVFARQNAAARVVDRAGQRRRTGLARAQGSDRQRHREQHGGDKSHGAARWRPAIESGIQHGGNPPLQG